MGREVPCGYGSNTNRTHGQFPSGFNIFRSNRKYVYRGRWSAQNGRSYFAFMPGYNTSGSLSARTFSSGHGTAIV